METYTVVGVMSGTSCDGLDLCLVKFKKEDNWQFEIIKTSTIDYDDKWKSHLSNVIHISPSEFDKLDYEFGRFIGTQINYFIDNSYVDLIASHGHTVFHQPHLGITKQIGDGHQIMITTGITTVNDFRSLDVSLGGQGAPLVPIGDHLLFKEYDACINLGGFSNISLMHKKHRIAFDICPVNLVLNRFAKDAGLEYDINGDIGRSGKVNEELLDKLNLIEHYKKQGPKSLSVEWLNTKFYPILDACQLPVKEIMRTLYSHIVHQITQTFKQFEIKKALITGGGALNSFLVDLIKEHSETEIILPSKEFIEFKEALIFAFLGVLRIRNEINCLSSVTGAKRDSSCGVIIPAIKSN